MITIRKVEDKNDLKKFIKFPFQLYKNCEYWVPPIIADEMESMDPDKNPVFKNAEASFFLAYKNGEIVGRVAAIINWLEVKEQHKSKMRFGWFDVIDDIEITKALINKVIEIGKQHQLQTIEGPVGFSNLDKAGLLTFGFDELNTMVTWYNYAYYKEHFDTLGFEKAAEWVEFKLVVSDGAPEKVARFSDILMERNKLQLLKFKNNKEVLPYVDEMFQLLNDTYSSLQTFVPIQQYQIDHYKNKYLRYINPDFIIGIVDGDKKLVAFAITMPAFSKALRKANGKLFPFGIFHLLKARRKNDTAAFYLIGVHPTYRNKGVTATIIKEMVESFNRFGVVKVETNPELEENKSVQALWKYFDTKLHKRRQTFRKSIV